MTTLASVKREIKELQLAMPKEPVIYHIEVMDNSTGKTAYSFEVKA
jgi:hypothetical protein